MQAVQQASKLEWMQQELRLVREERQELETTVEELKNQITELTTKTGEWGNITEKLQ